MGCSEPLVRRVRWAEQVWGNICISAAHAFGTANGGLRARLQMHTCLDNGQLENAIYREVKVFGFQMNKQNQCRFLFFTINVLLAQWNYMY